MLDDQNALLPFVAADGELDTDQNAPTILKMLIMEDDSEYPA